MERYSALPRREFIRRAGLAGLLLPLHSLSPIPSLWPAPTRKVAMFSKCLQWLDYDGLSSFVADCGFDGVDLTVRPGGHVEPASVANDLPRAAEALKKKGLELLLITTDIQHADDANAQAILKTAAALGVKGYRMGWYTYDAGKTVEENLSSFESSMRGLAKLNEQFQIKGGYQNHTGDGFGAAVWDVGRVLHDISSPWLGMQYDVRHATAEGKNSWVRGFEYVKPFINSMDIKDFYWGKENEKWKDINVPLGEGMVDFDKYFKLIGDIPDDVPLSLHAEYELGGAQDGNRQPTVKPDFIKQKLSADLGFIRSHLNH